MHNMRHTKPQLDCQIRIEVNRLDVASYHTGRHLPDGNAVV